VEAQKRVYMDRKCDLFITVYNMVNWSLKYNYKSETTSLQSNHDSNLNVNAMES